jgi:DNA-binding transcriptional MerR regulator
MVHVMAIAAPFGLSISDAAEATGLTAPPLRYYERAGLMLDPVSRASSSHRRFSDAEIRWIVLLTKLRATGMPIRRVREYVELVRDGAGNEDARIELLEAHRRDVMAQLAQMERDLAAIDKKIQAYREREGT